MSRLRLTVLGLLAGLIGCMEGQKQDPLLRAPLAERLGGSDKVETIVDGCAGLAHVTFGPLPQQLAYAKRADGQWRLVVGGTESEPFDEVDKPQFRDDGKMVAFGARKGRELWWKVMVLP